jgi:hypothetical protein
MQAVRHLRVQSDPGKEMSVAPALVTISLALGIALVWFLSSGYSFDEYPYAFILPWILALAIVLTVPSIVLYRKGRFSFADPLIFATWSYFFPAFVIGGTVFAFGWSQPAFLSYVQDVQTTLPLTIVLVALGFAGLSVGYFLPIGERIGSMIGERLPSSDHPLRSYVAPGILILVLGVINTAVAFAIGLFGFQRKNEFSQYDGLIYMTTLFWMQGGFLLWYILFRKRKLDLGAAPIVLLLVSTSLASMIFAGNRGSIVQIFTIIGLAFIISGREFRMKQAVVAGSLFSVFLVLGIIYGTTFRAVKGSESDQSVDLYAENVLTAFGEIQRASVSQSLEYGFASLAERIDILTTLAVVVSNYEALEPYEAAYGLDDNIWTDLTTFLIPRIVWNDKPAASDARKYSDLYFNNGGTSFAITPIGDLLRNYGVIGVPIGMLFLGIIMKTIYRSLLERQPHVVWRATLYFMLLTAVSYEGFFGTIIPNLVKVFVVAGIGLMIVYVLAGLLTRLMSDRTTNKVKFSFR